MFCPECGYDTDRKKCPGCGYKFPDKLISKWKEYDKDKYEKLRQKRNKKYCVLCYLFFLGVISFLQPNKTKVLKLHIKQGLVIDLLFVSGIMFLFVPKIGLVLGAFLLVVSSFLSFLGVNGVLKGEDSKLPIVKNILELSEDLFKTKNKTKTKT